MQTRFRTFPVSKIPLEGDGRNWFLKHFVPFLKLLKVLVVVLASLLDSVMLLHMEMENNAH